jgi:enamine deaminase RidA (YjgF/YER057c/UK114 family)
MDTTSVLASPFALPKNFPRSRVATAAESVVTLIPRRGEAIASFVERLAEEIGGRNAAILMLMIYGSSEASAEVEDELCRRFGGEDFPLTWVDGASCTGEKIAGAQAFVVGKTVKLQRISVGGRVVGTAFSDSGARHCLLGGLLPRAVALARPEQVQELLADAAGALASAGFGYGDLVRTWFYNDDLLAWYDAFNQVRTGFYRGQTFAAGSLPASTGISARNPRGAALIFGGWAVVPVSTGTVVREVASPLQCPAPVYGSSFSRAMEIVSGGRRRVLVSGTASIEPGGKTAWLGDAASQIDLSMKVVEAILKSSGLGFGDVTRATAYFKNADDVVLFKSWCAARGWERLPVVPLHCDICRDDLLFEIEVDACVNV